MRKLQEVYVINVEKGAEYRGNGEHIHFQIGFTINKSEKSDQLPGQRQEECMSGT